MELSIPFPMSSHKITDMAVNFTPVTITRESVLIPTYPEQAPDKNPMFLEKRVYQGSSGKVYPLPFTDRISEQRQDVAWDAVHLENEFIRLMVLPQIGGRIHAGQDKSNGYDFFYRQNVIKPALVGLAGPWISGGVEFNWPQHHRPATYLPVNLEFEEHEDGGKTVWLSDHDPMSRMKGMHGVCLHPGKAYIEVKVRLYNRTPLVQTFLWWANVAARVHDKYQSVFPPDVDYVADHAKRAMSAFPLCKGSYYGVNYAERSRTGTRASVGTTPVSSPNDLSWYWNIPVPTSYMCMGGNGDFFGGYDHGKEAGVIHVANHHISPGKKQWTWGNHEFGYAWDRQLTDSDGPYIELMAGVYTDNQPDFSFLQPGETKTFSQFWYPVQKIGPAQKANLHAACSLVIRGLRARVGLCVTSSIQGANLYLSTKGKIFWNRSANFEPGKPFIGELELPERVRESDLTLTLITADGVELLSHTPPQRRDGQVPQAATEPPMPEEIASSDELYITGLHLEQYRHATRQPELYWREALRRDPQDARCNNAMGLWHLRRGEFSSAETLFRRAIERLTRRNPNPYDGEPYYNLGLVLRFLGRDDEAYAAFYKACWNQAWQSAGYHALAELDACRLNWDSALEHLERSLRVNTDNLRARNLKVLVLQKLERGQQAEELLKSTILLDPLDFWARHLNREPLSCDAQTYLDIALDYARAGFFNETIGLLENCPRDGRSRGALPLVHYYLGFFNRKSGRNEEAKTHFLTGAKASPDYCFPARLEEIEILEAAMSANPQDARAPYYLGNLLYDKRRHEDGLRLWERAAKLDPDFSIVWRNLGIAYFNDLRDGKRARKAYQRALKANPADARLLYEQDQLWKKLGVSPRERLKQIEKNRGLVVQRDDLSVELAALYNQTGQPARARDLLAGRNFHPWEGGEGQVLGQHVRAHLALGRLALSQGNAVEARRLFETALSTPPNLAEAHHLLANLSNIQFWLGEACAALGDKAAAREWRGKAARASGDFQNMSVKAFSEMTYYTALSLERLGRKKAARKMFGDLLAYARNLLRTEAKIDYFATSLPAMLLFKEDLQLRQTIAATFLMAQAKLGLGRKSEAKTLLQKVLSLDINHPLAADLKMELE
ncbi:MAG: DUF5107 domain-containing protein [Methylacidiphilales bacterium]|nr:DUF5107 domain-containing protein [Candidatus Methylacidiphilales bacterium]